MSVAAQTITNNYYHESCNTIFTNKPLEPVQTLCTVVRGIGRGTLTSPIKFFLWLILKVHLLGSTFWPDTQYVPLSNSQKLDFSKKKLDFLDFQDFRTKWTYSWIIMVLWVEFAPHGKFFSNRDDFYTLNRHSRSFKGHARSFLALHWVSDSSNCLISKYCTKLIFFYIWFSKYTCWGVLSDRIRNMYPWATLIN